LTVWHFDTPQSKVFPVYCAFHRFYVLVPIESLSHCTSVGKVKRLCLMSTACLVQVMHGTPWQEKIASILSLLILCLCIYN